MIETSDPLEKMRRTSSTRSKLQQVIFPSLGGSRSGHPENRGEGGPTTVDHDQKGLAKRVQSAYRYIKQHSVEIHN